MPDKRHHRGPHPGDSAIFAQSCLPALQAAVADLSWLLSREYAEPSALKLVGDHHQLTTRQRNAVMRSACTDKAMGHRRSTEVPAGKLPGCALAIDGYNVLTSVEAALAGGALFICRDGCIRDVASMHGSFRKVEETLPALCAIGSALDELKPSQIAWYLDAPVSNSGRLKTMMAELAEARHWSWDIQIVQSPDRVLMECAAVVASADSIVIDAARRWFNLSRWVISRATPGAWIVDLSQDSCRGTPWL